MMEFPKLSPSSNNAQSFLAAQEQQEQRRQ